MRRDLHTFREGIKDLWRRRYEGKVGPEGTGGIKLHTVRVGRGSVKEVWRDENEKKDREKY